MFRSVTYGRPCRSNCGKNVPLTQEGCKYSYHIKDKTVLNIISYFVCKEIAFHFTNYFCSLEMQTLI